MLAPMKRIMFPAIALSLVLALAGCSSDDHKADGPAGSGIGSAQAPVTEDIGSGTTMTFTLPEGYVVGGNPDGTAVILTSGDQSVEDAVDWLLAISAGKVPTYSDSRNFMALAAMPCEYTASPEKTSHLAATNGWRFGMPDSGDTSLATGLQYNQATEGPDCLAAVVTAVRTPADPALEGAVKDLLSTATVTFPVVG